MIWKLSKLLNFALKVERKTGAKYSAHGTKEFSVQVNPSY